MSNNYIVGIEAITPDKASALLSHFPRNRSLSRPRIDSYCDIMKRGCWAPFSTIIIDENGNTIDGYHRLEAIIKSGTTVNMTVFRGLETKYIPFIDTGRNRSAGDMLAFVEKIDGITSLRNIAALARAIIYFVKDLQGKVVPPDELANFIIENRDSVKTAYNDYLKIKNIGGTLSHAAAIWVVRHNNPSLNDCVDDFVNKIANGENICSGMPTYAARNAILLTHSKPRGGITWRESFYTIFRAWNAEIKGEKIHQIKLKFAIAENIRSINITKEAK